MVIELTPDALLVILDVAVVVPAHACSIMDADAVNEVGDLLELCEHALQLILKTTYLLIHILNL